MYVCTAQWKDCRGPTLTIFTSVTILRTHCCKRHNFEWNGIRTSVRRRRYKHYANATQCYVELILPILFPCLLITNFPKGSPFHPVYGTYIGLYTRVNKNPSAWNFLSPKPEVTCGTVAIIIRVLLLPPYLRIRAVSLSSIHYNQSHRVYINRRRQYICLIWN